MTDTSDAPLPEDPDALRCRRFLEQPDTLWHLVGIGGIGVSAVARLLLGVGHRVRGSDVRASQLTRSIAGDGADVRIGHSGDHLVGVDVVVVSTAIPETNPEILAAREMGISVLHRSHLLGALMDRYPTVVGVSGTHGKGTVSAAVVAVLCGGRLDPGFAIGGLVLDQGTNARAGGGSILVAELDESDGSLRNTRPTVAVINNLELDHLNYYSSWEKLAATMLSFVRENPRLRRLVLNAGDEGLKRILPELRSATKAEILTFGLDEPGADLWARNARPLHLDDGVIGGSMEVLRGGDVLGEVRLRIPGRYNLSNALGALAVALDLGVSFEEASAALFRFHGLENRFTVVQVGRCKVVKDYVSHPTGIRRVLEGAAHFGSAPVVAVFKPYRFTMIHYLHEDYREAFRGADHVVVTELYTAGEVPIPGIDTDFLCRNIREGGAEVSFVPEMDDLIDHLRRHHPDAGMVIFFGGDDLFATADRFVEELLRATGP